MGVMLRSGLKVLRVEEEELIGRENGGDCCEVGLVENRVGFCSGWGRWWRAEECEFKGKGL